MSAPPQPSAPPPAVRMAAALHEICRRRGVEPEPALQLSQVDLGILGQAPPVAGTSPADLGVVHQALRHGPARRRSGAWYTPADVAAHLVRLALPDRRSVGVVRDPAVGGGVFLLAAADRLVELGADPAQVATELLQGADVDATAVAVTEAALWLWTLDHGSPMVPPQLHVADALVEDPWPECPPRAVVGNPPFLGQLKQRTATDADRRAQLRARFGSAVAAYTDEAWLFLLAAVESVGLGGRVVMIQPQSVLAARDAGRVRARIEQRAGLIDCWIGAGGEFDALVDVCAPVLAGGRTSSTTWTAAVSAASGIPDPPLPAPRDGHALGDRAGVVAGFRDEYYGMVEALGELPDDAHPCAAARPLVTCGAIDPVQLLWSVRPVRVAKRWWRRPVVDGERLVGRARTYAAAQARPKLLVATQTKVLEVVVDEEGHLLGSVPVISVLPDDPDDLWPFAAALLAPPVSAWLIRRTAGTALSAAACKPTARALAELPLPVDARAWSEATAALQAVRAAGVAGAGAAAWSRYADAACRAYAVEPEGLADWWLSRLPLR